MLQFFRRGGKRIKTLWWIIIIATVGSFILGFIFLPGAMNDLRRGGGGNDIGAVNGDPISRTEYANALAEQRATYARQYGLEPADRDLKMLEVQAWRSLIVQRLLDEKAKSLGLDAHDREVVLTLQSQPPAILRENPSFQTNGQFDPAKYQAELRNPNNNWAAFEDMVRRQLPMRKFQERLLSSIKISENELREAYRDRFERLNATAVQVPAITEGAAGSVSDADMQRLYDRYKNRFSHGPRTQLEALIVPKQVGQQEVKQAQDLANSLVRRARSGENFQALARDYSEGPGAENGGVLNRVLQPADFGQMIGAQIATMDTGKVTEPFQDGGRFLIFKLLGRDVDPKTNMPGVRVAQIVVKVRPDEQALQTQLQDLLRLRQQAARSGLGKAAAAKGLTTVNTGYFEMSNPPQDLFTVPEAADWGLSAKQGEVSPVFHGLDEYVIAQVVKQEGAGVPTREELANELKQLAQLDVGVERNKPKAEAIAKAVAAGQSLEQAAAAAGLQTTKVDGMTRAQPDQRFTAVPELVGQLFAAKPGQVVGPIRGVNGWYFARLDERTPADMAMFDQVKGQFSGDLLQRRQSTFYNNYLATLRNKAKVKDTRLAGEL